MYLHVAQQQTIRLSLAALTSSNQANFMDVSAILGQKHLREIDE